MLLRSALRQLEERQGVGAADLQAVGLADGGVVEPVCGMVHVLEGPVGGEQEAVRAHFEQRIDQRLRAEVARGGQVEILVEIVAQLALRGVALGHVHPGVAVVHAPHVVGQAFAEVAQDDPEAGVPVEQAAGHEAQRMHGGFLRERPGGAHQPGMALVDLRPAGDGVARVQVEGRVQPFHGGPEIAVLRRVVIDHVLGRADLREAVDQRTAEAQVLHAALQLARGEVGVLHGQRREGLEAVRPAGHLLGEEVVGAHGDLHGLARVGNGLHGGRVEGQDHHLHAVGVHLAQAPLMDVQQAQAQLLPVVAGDETGRILQRLRNGEMFFQADLSLHVLSPLRRCARPVMDE